MKNAILCIGGCLDGERIHFRGRQFDKEYFKNSANNFAKNKTEIGDFKTHTYKLEEIFDRRNRKQYQIYIYEKITEPFGVLIDGYCSNN